VGSSAGRTISSKGSTDAVLLWLDSEGKLTDQPHSPPAGPTVPTR